MQGPDTEIRIASEQRTPCYPEEIGVVEEKFPQSITIMSILRDDKAFKRPPDIAARA